MEYEFILGKTPFEVACPKDGWLMRNLQDHLQIHITKETLRILTTAVRDALANGAFIDVDKAQKLFKDLNWAMNSFEDKTRFLRMDENGFVCNSVSLEG